MGTINLGGNSGNSVKLFQIDAFADRLFSGNPAAVVPLPDWLPTDAMQAIARENNLSETAFFAAEGDAFRLRWFTPTTEVDLCGHATLASAHVLFEHYGYSGDCVTFRTLSGDLIVRREDARLAMDFPARQGNVIPIPADLAAAIGAQPLLALDTKPIVLLFEDAAQVAAIQPDFGLLKMFCDRHDRVGVAVTAVGAINGPYDFVSRLFAPSKGIEEDPVTGAAHTALVPFWASRLSKTELVARQISSRGGTLWCTLAGNRVIMRGTARTICAAQFAFRMRFAFNAKRPLLGRSRETLNVRNVGDFC